MSTPKDKAFKEMQRLINLTVETVYKMGAQNLHSGEDVLTVPKDKRYKSSSDLMVSNLPNIKPLDITKFTNEQQDSETND